MKYAVRLFFFISTFLSAQYKIDVKTTFEEWLDFSVIQNVQDGVEQLIDSSNFARISEFDENYSLWLKNYAWLHADDSISIKLSIELRTPSSIFEGDLIESTDIELKYHWEEMRSHSDSIDLDIFNLSNEKISDIIAILETIEPLVKVVANNLDIPGTLIMRLIPKNIKDSSIETIIKLFEGNPSPVDILISSILTQQIFIATERMIETTGYKKKSPEEKKIETIQYYKKLVDRNNIEDSEAYRKIKEWVEEKNKEDLEAYRKVKKWAEEKEKKDREEIIKIKERVKGL